MLEMQRANKINTHRANYQNESIVTDKSTICQTLLSWKMLNLKSKRMYENTTKVIEEVDVGGEVGAQRNGTHFSRIFSGQSLKDTPRYSH